MEAATTHRTAQNDDPEPTPPSRSWSRENTRILPEAFNALDAGSTLNIFDAGPVEPQSIDFFRRYRCRIHVANLLNPAFPAHGVESAPEFFKTVGRVRFDVCFLWDYLNYPDNEALAEFISILADHVHEKTRLYVIGAYSAKVPLRAYRYAISDIDKVAIRPAGGNVPQPRSQSDILKAMRRYAVQRAALRRDNRLELLLRTVRTNWS